MKLSAIFVLFFISISAYAQSYVKFDIPFEPVNKTKPIIEAAENLTLKDRGEAHITIFSPQETTELKKKHVDLKKMQKAVDSGRFAIEGIGYSENNNGKNRVYYVVITSPDFQKIRTDLGFPEKDFHITIGFVKGDIHDVRKNVCDERITKLCSYYLTILSVKLSDNLMYEEKSSDACTPAGCPVKIKSGCSGCTGCH